MSGETGGKPAGDALDRVWGATSANGLLVSAFIATAVLFGGAFFAVTAYGPTKTEPATVLRQYFESTSSSRRICGIEVQVASGEKTKAAGGSICSAYDVGDQAVAIVSTLTGDVVGVRHAGRDLGRSGNPLVGFVPIFALVPLVTSLMAADRRRNPTLLKMTGAAVAGGLFGLVIYWVVF